jgi:hypothetical protein
MRWSVFILTAYVALLLQAGLANLLAYGDSAVTPSFLLILGVFVGMWAPPRTVAWAMLVLGLLTDLTHAYPIGDVQMIYLVGPASLGYLLGATAVCQLRSMVFRDSALALMVMVFLVGILVHLAAIALLTIRGWPWIPGEPIAGYSQTHALVEAFKQLLYTTLLALPVGYVLQRTSALWRFEPAKPKRGR